MHAVGAAGQRGVAKCVTNRFGKIKNVMTFSYWSCARELDVEGPVLRLVRLSASCGKRQCTLSDKTQRIHRDSHLPVGKRRFF
jgi:hypothetical protein